MKFLLCIVLAVVACSQARHVRRDTNLDELRNSFPKQEWEAFWGKLTEVLGEKKAEFTQKLEENQGNMDLTLTQFKDKLTTDYPQLQAAWERVKTKWDELSNKLSETTLNDVFKWLKERVSGAFSNMSPDAAQNWFESAKTYFISFYNRMSQEMNRSTFLLK